MRTMMDSFIKQHYKRVIIVIISLILCIFLSVYIGPKSDYSIFINVLLGCISLFLVCKSIYSFKSNGLSFKLLVILALYISNNHLFSTSEIKQHINWIQQNILFCLIGLFGIICLLIAILCFRYIKKDNTKPIYSEEEAVKPSVQNETISKPEVMAQKHLSTKKRLLSFLRLLVIMILIVAIVSFSIWLYFRLDLSSITNNVDTDMSLLLSSLISNGATIIFIIFAVSLIILALIELARFLYSRFLLFVNEKNHDLRKSNDTLTLVFSVLIVFAMLFLAYKISNVTLDDFTEFASNGKYIALPLIVLLGIVAVIILIRLTHGILLLVMKTEAIDVAKFVKENQEILKIKDKIVQITKSLVEIILGTIESALSFVEFIPDFFKDMIIMVVSDDEESADDNDD